MTDEVTALLRSAVKTLLTKIEDRTNDLDTDSVQALSQSLATILNTNLLAGLLGESLKPKPTPKHGR